MAEVRCGNLILLYSNRICCANDQSVQLKVDLPHDNKLSLTFEFNYDGSERKANLQSKTNGEITISLYNYNNPFGTGLKAPAEIGTINGKKLFIIFFVYKLPEAAPILDFSLYMEE